MIRMSAQKIKNLGPIMRKGLLVLGIFCLVWAYGQAAQAQARGDANLYNIQGVSVDETAANAVEARNKALSSGQFKAFEQLLEQLLKPEDRANVQMPTIFQLQSMVQSFELQNERTSRNRYIAQMNVQFKAPAINAYLGNVSRTAPVTVAKSRPVLVVPFFQSGTQTILWDGLNPWKDAWNRVQNDTGLVPVRVPVGDTQDMIEMPDTSIMGQNMAGLQSALRRYEAGSALMVTLMPERVPVADGGQYLRVFMLRFGEGFSNQSETIIVPPMPELSANEFLDAAVQMAMKHLNDDWKKRAQKTANVERRIRAYFVFSNIREWAQVSRRLREIELIKDISIDRLAPARAEVSISYRGDMDMLRMALEQKDLTLSTPSEAQDAGSMFAAGRAPDNYQYQILMR